MPSVQELLNDLQRSAEPAEKTASDQRPTDVDTARSALQQRLSQVNGADQNKTAAQNGAQNGAHNVSAVQELTKIASDLAEADEAAQIKIAQLYGAAAADGFLQRMNQYAANAPAQQKVAAAQPADATFTQAQQAQPADATFTQAQQAQVDAMTKMASELGYSDAENALNRLVAASNAQTKQAAQQGHPQYAQQGHTQPRQKTAAEQDAEGVWAAAEKVAAASEDCFIRGYEAMEKIAEALS